MSVAALLLFTLAAQNPGLEPVADALARERRALEAEKAALQEAREALDAGQARAEAAHLSSSAKLAETLEGLRIELEALEQQRRARTPRAVPKIDDAEAAEAALFRELRSRLVTPTEGEPHRPSAAAPRPTDLGARVLASDLRDRAVHTSTGVAFFALDGTEHAGRVEHLGALAAYAYAGDVQGPLQRIGDRWALVEAAPVGQLFGEPGPALVPLVWGTPHEGAGDEKPPFFESRIEAGGSVAIAILVLAALAGLVFVERLLRLWHGTRGDEAFADRFVKDLARGGWDDIRGALEGRVGWVAELVKARLQLLDRPQQIRAELTQAALAHQVQSVERGVGFLKLVAAVAPLLGLLGTVMGMIETFDVLGTHGAGDARLLSGGISKALVTTELGLIVAIPTLFAHSLASSWIDRVVDRLERVGLEPEAPEDAP